MTSRNRLTSLVASQGARALTLDLLAGPEARELLARRLGPDRVAADPAAVEEIISRCARLPLALTVAAAQAATRPGLPLAALAGELHDARDRLDALAGDDPSTDVRTVLSWSYRQLSTAAARLFRLLGLHPGADVAVAAAASLYGGDAAEVRPLLAELRRTSLLTEHAAGRYTFHDLLRAYAAEQAARHDDAQERQAALGRLLDHYLAATRAAAEALSPGATRCPPRVALSSPATAPAPDGARAWLDTERPTLVTVRAYAGTGHAHRTAGDLRQARAGWQRALDLYRDLDAPEAHDLRDQLAALR